MGSDPRKALLDGSSCDNERKEPFLFSRRTVRCGLIKKRLEDECGRHLIDHAAMLLAGMACLVENLVGLVSGQPFIPEVNGETGQFT